MVSSRISHLTARVTQGRLETMLFVRPQENTMAVIGLNEQRTKKRVEGATTKKNGSILFRISLITPI